jgi:hypothetical protein
MSRWLKSVNNLLDNLDGTAENVVNEPGTAIPTSRGAIGQILSRRGMDYDDDEEDYDDGEYEEDDDDYSEDEEQGTNTPPTPEEIVDFSKPPPEEEASFVMTPAAPKQAPPAPLEPLSSGIEPQVSEEDEEVAQQPGFEKTVSLQVPPPSSVGAAEYYSDASAVIVNKPADVASVATEEASPPPTIKAKKTIASPPRSGLSSNVLSAPASGLSTNTTTDPNKLQTKKLKQELKKSQLEARQLRKHVMQLNQELEASESEVKAQQEELQRAAERMEKDRHRANEEREDLLDEQEDELVTQKTQYEKELQDQKDRYEDQLEEMQRRLALVEEKRMQEGGDWTKELEDTIQRERDSIKKLSGIKEENATLKSSMAKLETQYNALQAKLDSTSQAHQTANDREREAEDKLDATLSMHSRQLSQRQAREAELERTIADIGAALARSRQKEKIGASPKANTDNITLKEQFEFAVDELETARAQLTLESERCDALRNELADISKERTAEATDAQARQRQQAREMADLKSTVSRLQVSLRERKSAPSAMSGGDADAPQLYQQLEESKMQIGSLSEQLLRQQGASQNSKQEILALKNRLQSATARAESAETALVTTTSNRSSTFEVEGGLAHGGASMRRRVKGGRSNKATQGVRSIRSTLGMNPGRVNGAMEQVAVTVDAIDSFLIDTGSFMKQEPVARLGFVLYLCILHLWSFCLVIFHASSYEDVHGDFGSMSDPGGHGPQHLSQP